MTHPDVPAHTRLSIADQSTQGNLLGLLTAGYYSLMTLLPNSNSLMVAWPWVLIWQVGLLCPMLWLLGLLWQRKVCWLGHRLDWVAGALFIGLILSAGLAQFPMQAHWYSWAAFCFLAALYALSTWLNVPERRICVLQAQGYLSLAFIVISLALWSRTTWLPELSRLQTWRQYGVNLAFDFATVELRNWAPLGHQNYVAGYLVLALPLLLGLGLVQTGWRRLVWLLGTGLGLLDLYTTSSRAGWLGLVVVAIAGFAVLLWRSSLPRLWLALAGGGGGLVLVLVLLANNRLRSLASGALSGQASGELAYRVITVATGWQMGVSHWLTGLGLGGVPLLFQQYRPAWAGRQAEWAYQLHSTPAHLWAELGIWAVVVALGAIAILGFLGLRWLRTITLTASLPSVLIASLFGGLLGYGLVSLTDYQLDNVGISGFLIVLLAVLVAEFRDRAWQVRYEPMASPEAIELPAASPHPLTLLLLHPIPFLALVGLGILLAAVVWLIPVHRAWLLSSQGFAALSRGDLPTFVQRLDNAHQLANWEPYYPYQLGWNLGNLGLQTRDPQAQQQQTMAAIAWLKRGIQSSPDQEFGYTNLAWLLLDRDPQAAGQAFVRSAQLLPAKRGVFYGLGLSLLAQGKTELAIAAITLEALREPAVMTSPIWKLPGLQPLYTPVLSQIEAQSTAMLQTVSATAPLATQLHQIRGGLRWWRGDLAGAHADLDASGTELSRLVLDLAGGKPVSSPLAAAWATVDIPANRSGALAIAAWLNPAQRQNLLQQAWILATHTDPAIDVVSELATTMTRAASFDQWLKQAPSQRHRFERAGFGVLSRHIDGPVPIDFLTVIDNVPITQFFKPLIPSFDYVPELDTVLQPKRDALLQAVSR